MAAGGMIQITLPFPAKVLWPNGRPGHWAVKARAVKHARHEAYWAVCQAYRPNPRPVWQAVKLHWTIHPKTANKIDDDAPPAALKAYRDGIADALGIDDQNFSATYSISSPIKGGAVIVHIEEAPANER